MSVWAMPSESDASVLRAVMERLASGPAFDPHITLLGDAPIPSRAGLVGLDAFPVTLISVSDSPERYRCVVLEADASETLRSLHESLGGDVATYAPHASLVYGELDATERERLRAIVDVELPMTITIDAIAIVDTTSSNVAQWRVTERIALG